VNRCNQSLGEYVVPQRKPSKDDMGRCLNEYYRLPSDWNGRFLCKEGCGDPGFFRFGSEVCYGRCASGPTAKVPRGALYDAFGSVYLEQGSVCLPFNPSEVIDNLRGERYTSLLSSGRRNMSRSVFVRKMYYGLREFLPIRVRRQLQRAYFSGWRELGFPNWPVDSTVDSLHEDFLRLSMAAKGIKRVPFIWFWPEGAANCLIMTHDVETVSGRDFTDSLMDLDDAYGIKAAFQVVPEERYEVPDSFVEEIRARGFEFNVHDLNHDGTLFRDHRQFLHRAAKINEYVRKYQSLGFRSGSMYRNQDWYNAYEFRYDMSVPSVAHLEPQRGGCCTIMPYFIGDIVEIPLTTAQDYSLFHILKDYSLDVWKTQISLIQAKHGLISFIIHPDYVIESRARRTFEGLLDYLREMISREDIWLTLPREVDRWWRVRSRMTLVPNGPNWVIEGPEKERARVAFAVLDGDRLVYEFQEAK